MILPIVLVAIAIVILIAGISSHNHLVTVKNNAAMAWSNIDVLLKQRHDELPKLIETCKQYMKYEQDTLERVMKARTAVHTASASGDLSALGPAENELRSGLGKLYAVAEAYPDLKASESFKQLQSRISNIETSIADRRERYNDAVNANNASIERFPASIIASLFSFKEAKPLEFTDADRADVDVKALFNS